MARPNAPFDFVLNSKGYFLARREQLGRGGRAWQVSAVGSSIAQQSASEMRYGNQSPMVEAPMVWRTAHLGFGDSQQRAEGRYHYTLDVDARFPEQVIPGPLVTTLVTEAGGNVKKLAEFDGQLFALAGQYVLRIEGDDSVVQDKDLGPDKTAIELEPFGDYLYATLGFGAGDFIWRRDAAGNWSQSQDVQRGHMVVLNEKLWATTGDAKVKAVSNNPFAAGDWGSEYSIGDQGTDITDLAGLDDLLYIGKMDGLHALDSSGNAKMLTPELRGSRSAYNAANMRAWHGRLWVPHLRGLFAYRNLGDNGFLIQSAAPARDSTDDNPVWGVVTAIAGDERWLYAALYDGTDTYILAGREAASSEESLGAIIWHPMAKLAGVRCDAMHISGLWNNPRLFFGAGEDVSYIVLPKYGDNPLQDSACRYAQSGSIYFPAHSWGAPTTTKVWKSVEVEAENLTVTRYLDIYYRIDGGSWVKAGTANVSPRFTMALEAAGAAGNKIEVRADFVLPSTSMPIILHSITLRGTERPAQIELITAVVRCADGLPQCPRAGRTILADLKALSRNSAAVILRDIIGTNRRVLVLAPVDEQETEQQGSSDPEVLATVRMVVFAATPTSPAVANYNRWGSFKWGDGTQWK
jgi:hypothetical protein